MASKWGYRPDGTEKGDGYLGILTNAHGDSITEYSVGINLDGEEIDVPTLVPTLTKAEVKAVLKATENDAPPPPSVVDKAARYAISRKQSGLSIFASQDDYKQTQKWRSAIGLD